MIVLALAMSLSAQAVPDAERPLRSPQVQTGAVIVMNGEPVTLVGIDAPAPDQGCWDRDDEP